MSTCRDGHLSDEPDYCSVCGVAMGQAGPPPLPRASHAGGAKVCPECAEPRTDLAARFCEVCRFDFISGKAGSAPAVTQAPAPGMTSPPVVASQGLWEAVVTIEPALDKDPDPASPCPVGQPEQAFPVDMAEMLIGRRDDRRDIHPEVPLRDPGASRRHAKLLRNADGSVTLLDLASANGTWVNGAELAPGTRRALAEGDAVTLGRWTRIVLRSRR